MIAAKQETVWRCALCGVFKTTKYFIASKRIVCGCGGSMHVTTDRDPDSEDEPDDIDPDSKVPLCDCP